MFEEFDDNNEQKQAPQHSPVTIKQQRSPFSKWFKIATIAFIILLIFFVGLIIGIFAINTNSSDLALLNEVKKIVDKYYYGDIDWENVDLNSTNAMLHYISQFNGISVENDTLSEGVYGFSFFVDSYNSRYVRYVQPTSAAFNESGRRVTVTKQNNRSGLTVQEVYGDNTEYKLRRGDKIYGILPYIEKTTTSENDYVLLDGLSDDAYLTYMAVKFGWLVIERTNTTGVKEYFEIMYYKTISGVHYSSYTTVNGRNDIGYIDLTTFGHNDSIISLYNSVRQYVEDANANKLILDLRGNGGGLIDLFRKIAPLFVPHGSTELPAMKLIDKYGGFEILNFNYGTYSGLKSDYIGTYKNNASQYDLIVLVDGNSASASEALCGVINCYNDRALIIGTDTYGKGVAQSEFKFDNDRIIMRLVTAKYYVPVDSGTAWQNFHGRTIPLDYNFNLKENYNELTTVQKENFGRPFYDLSQDIVIAKAIEFFDSAA